MTFFERTMPKRLLALRSKPKGPETYERVFYVDCYYRVHDTQLRKSTEGNLSVLSNTGTWYEVTADGKVLNGWGIKWYRP